MLLLLGLQLAVYLLHQCVDFHVVVFGLSIASSLECCFAVGNCMHEFVVSEEGWVSYALVFELDGVSESFRPGILYVAVVHAVVFWRSEEVPSIHTVI